MQWGAQVQCADQSTRASFQSHISLLIRFRHQHHHHHYHHVQQYHHLSSTISGRTARASIVQYTLFGRLHFNCTLGFTEKTFHLGFILEMCRDMPQLQCGSEKLRTQSLKNSEFKICVGVGGWRGRAPTILKCVSMFQ